ncbi:MAG: alcohol dehydrogenase catalytic domain-containing protein [Paracoccaceae bacterium]|nr:alcohol dehydrogenase catalytic domain-containing protein [Paracoccaceae bacterium]
MRALVYTGPRGLELRDVARPVAGEGQALVDVAACGICGSDMHAYLGHDERRPPPLVLGHEAAGVALDGPLAGRRVTVNPLESCGDCDFCAEGRDNLCPDRRIISMPPREGAFAEQVVVPARNLVEVPDGVRLEHAALAEPIACGWHALRLAGAAMARPLAATRVVILGGGAIGVGAALVTAASGAREILIAETNRARHATLGAAGPFQVYDPSEGEPEAGSADLVVDAYGGAASRAASTRLARAGGVITHVGLAGGDQGLDMRRATLHEITVIGTYTYTMADFRDTARAIFDGRLGDFGWVETRPIEAGIDAFAALDQGSVAASKIVLTL